MTIKEWIQTYCRELEGSDAEREARTGSNADSDLLLPATCASKQ